MFREEEKTNIGVFMIGGLGCCLSLFLHKNQYSQQLAGTIYYIYGNKS
jgi:hypothetical protein